MGEKEEKKDEVKVSNNNTENKTEKKVEKKIEEKPKFEKVKVENKENKKNDNKKKSKDSKNTENKKNVANVIRAIIVIAIVALIATGLTYMIVNTSNPKQTIDGFFTNMKAGEFEKSKEFLKIDEEENYESTFDDETKKLLFNKLNWKVKKVDVEDNSAVAELEVTNKDFKKVVENYMRKVAEAAKAMISGKEISQEEIKGYFKEELANDKISTITSTREIELVKEDRKWKIVLNGKLIETLVPELVQAMNSAI